MARRPRKAKNDQPQTGDVEWEGEGAGPGHNGPEPLTDEERIALAYHWKRRVVAGEAKKKEGAKESADAYKAAEREGIAKDVLKQLVALDTAEGQEKAEAEVAARVLACRWAGLDMGAQDDLFAEDRTPLVDKAYSAGKVAAMNGEDCISPWEPGSGQGQAWIRGWQDGQAVMVSMLKKLDSPVPILDAAEALPEEGQPEAPGLTDDQIDAVVPPTAMEDGREFDPDPEMPSFLKRQQPAREPAEVD